MIVLTIVLSLLTVLSLFTKGYFPMHDDLQVMRIFQMEICFADGQFPCRWSPDMAFGYGQAMFNFYSAFPYYLGVIIRQVFMLSIIDSVKSLFIVSIVASGVGMYFLGRELFGRSGGLIASVLYLYAPYRALNVYVRGALAEAFSLAILPLLWFAIYKTIKRPNFTNVLFLALLIGAQLSTHNISTMLYVPFSAIWALYWIAKSKEVKSIWALLLSGVFGFGLAGFFILPVIFEKNLIQEEIFTSDYSFYAAHFVSLKQIFVSRFWGYGGSIFGENDHMSFQVGWPHWWAAIVVSLVGVLQFIKTRKSMWLMVLGLVGMGVISLLLAHQKSYLIWENVSALSFVQFPWRFLGLAVFFLSLSAGALSLIKVPIFKHIIVGVFVLLAVALNYQYFRPDMHFYEETDSTKLSGELFKTQQKAAYLDYLPKTVPEAPLSLAPDRPQVVSGDAEIPNFTKTSSTFFFDANVYDTAEVDIPIIYFPNWEVYILEGQGIPVAATPSGKHGTIHIDLPEGRHMVYGRFVNTPVRTIGNALTIASFLALLSGWVVTSNNKKFLGLS